MGKCPVSLSSLLSASEFDKVEALYRESGYSVIRGLLALTYDKGDLLCWRAITAVGRIASGMSDGESRSLAQRILWMMRDESGGNPWSGAELVGEIIRSRPESLKDIAPVLISFQDEEIFKPGVLYAMARLAEARADLVEPFAGVPLGYIKSADPAIRGHALLALAALKKKEHIPAIESLLGDSEEFEYYDGNALVRRTIGSVAADFVGH